MIIGEILQGCLPALFEVGDRVHPTVTPSNQHDLWRV
jgi:hypothetical protein